MGKSDITNPKNFRGNLENLQLQTNLMLLTKLTNNLNVWELIISVLYLGTEEIY